MVSPLICLAELSPSTHLIASTTFDFPHPLGPTTPVKSVSNEILSGSTKDLNQMFEYVLNAKFCPSMQCYD